jgi:hypothetical protein
VLRNVWTGARGDGLLPPSRPGVSRLGRRLRRSACGPLPVAVGGLQQPGCGISESRRDRFDRCRPAEHDREPMCRRDGPHADEVAETCEFRRHTAGTWASLTRCFDRIERPPSRSAVRAIRLLPRSERCVVGLMTSDRVRWTGGFRYILATRGADVTHLPAQERQCLS